jgi:hypothetical protein
VTNRILLICGVSNGRRGDTRDAHSISRSMLEMPVRER